MPPQEAEDKASTHAITIRLPEDLYEDLRRQAYEQRTSINALIVEAVRVKQALQATPRRAPPGPVRSRQVAPRPATLRRVGSRQASPGHAP